MKFTGKVTENNFINPACKQVLTINYCDQDIDIECFMLRDHNEKHGGELKVFTSSKKQVGLTIFYWDDSGILETAEDRQGFAVMLSNKIPALNKKVQWPCKCVQCSYEGFSPKWEMEIGRIIINLNDICKWGRTSEENPEKNIIDWLNSLDIDFEVKE